MNFSGFLLKLFGWKVVCTVPDIPKCVICVAPHTSNWDFILGELAWSSLSRKAGFLMKKDWFFFPMNLIFKAMGGIPVPRSHKDKGPSVTETVINKFLTSKRLNIAIAPEGTRKKVAEWHTGFLRIALGAKVPVVLGAIDAARKTVHIEQSFMPSPDIEADMAAVRDYYKPFAGLKDKPNNTDK